MTQYWNSKNESKCSLEFNKLEIEENNQLLVIEIVFMIMSMISNNTVEKIGLSESELIHAVGTEEASISKIEETSMNSFYIVYGFNLSPVFIPLQKIQSILKSKVFKRKRNVLTLELEYYIEKSNYSLFYPFFIRYRGLTYKPLLIVNYISQEENIYIKDICTSEKTLENTLKFLNDVLIGANKFPYENNLFLTVLLSIHILSLLSNVDCYEYFKKDISTEKLIYAAQNSDNSKFIDLFFRKFGIKFEKCDRSASSGQNKRKKMFERAREINV